MIVSAGASDNTGYHEAQVGGRVGLVPATYLQPAPLGGSTSRRTRPNKSLTANNTSPEQILEMHNHLQQSHVPNHSGNYYFLPKHTTN